MLSELYNDNEPNHLNTDVQKLLKERALPVQPSKDYARVGVLVASHMRHATHAGNQDAEPWFPGGIAGYRDSELANSSGHWCSWYLRFAQTSDTEGVPQPPSRQVATGRAEAVPPASRLGPYPYKLVRRWEGEDLALSWQGR